MLSIKEIIEKLKKKHGLKSNAYIEEMMGVVNGQLGMWASRNTLSIKLIDFCLENGLSLDEIFSPEPPDDFQQTGFTQRLHDRAFQVFGDEESVKNQLSLKAQISRDRVKQLLNGLLPDWSTMIRLADALDVTIDWLLKGNNETGCGENLQTFGERITYGRECALLKPHELANLLLITTSELDAFESNLQTPAEKTLQKISDVLCLHEQWLLTGTGPIIKPRKQALLLKSIDPATAREADELHNLTVYLADTVFRHLLRAYENYRTLNDQQQQQIHSTIELLKTLWPGAPEQNKE